MSHAGIPLLVGVVGHIDLRPQDHEELEAGVRGVFQALRQDMDGVPLTLVTSLAEGADRLAARVAQEMGLGIIVTLPMERSLYEKEFTNEASRQEFRDWLERADGILEVPLDNDVDRVLAATPGRVRDRQYAKAGAYLVRHCQVLLALWDGEETQHEAGTATTLRWAEQGVPEDLDDPSRSLDAPEVRLIYEIRTPREGKPPPADAFRCRTRVALDADETRIRTCLKQVTRRIHQFNQDFDKLAPRLAQRILASKDRLSAKYSLHGLPRSIQASLDLFAVADTLAVYYRRQTHMALAGVFLLVLSAVGLFELFAHAHPERGLLLGYSGVFASAYAVFWWTRRRDAERRYLDYRALAEGLRVDFFWSLAEVHQSVSDVYLRRQRDELAWIRVALLSIGPGSGALDEAAWEGQLDWKTRNEWVRSKWVEDQFAFFRVSAKRTGQVFHRQRIIAHALIGIGVLGAVAWGLLDASLVIEDGEHASHLSGWRAGAVIAIAMAVLSGGLLRGYAERLGSEAHSHRYMAMCEIFELALGRLNRAVEHGDARLVRSLLNELGRECLFENSEWLRIRRERPLEVPAPG